MNKQKKLIDNLVNRLIWFGVQFTSGKLIKCNALYYDTRTYYIANLRTSPPYSLLSGVGLN